MSSTHVDPKIIRRWQTLPLVERLRDWGSTLPKPLTLTEVQAVELMGEAARELEWRRALHAPAPHFGYWFSMGLGLGMLAFVPMLVYVLSNQP